MDKLEQQVFIHSNIRLRESNLKRRDQVDDNGLVGYQLINLDYIFKEADSLGEWLAEEPRPPILPDGNFLDKLNDEDNDENSDLIPSSVPPPV